MKCNTDNQEGVICIEEAMDLQLPPPELAEFYNRLQTRDIVWNDEITDKMIEVPLYILKWNREDKGIPIEERMPIRLWINSVGGDANITLFTANIIALSKTPVITIGMGKSYSGGALLLMSGHKRLIFDSTSVLIHDGSFGVAGDAGKVFDNCEFNRELTKRMNQFIVTHSNISDDLIKSKYRNDWFMFSEDIIKYGIADKIVEDLSEVL